MTAYTMSVERALQLCAKADAMPIRKFFADGQRLARCEVLHKASQALNDAHDAANRIEYLDGIRFALDGKAAILDAKLAYRSLDDVDSFAAFREAARAEQARMRDMSTIVSGFAPDATPGQRATMLATVRLGAAGDEGARIRLREAIVAAVTTNSSLRDGGATQWGAHDALADELARRLTSTTDAATIDTMVAAMTSSWSDQVFASVTERIATTAEDSRMLLSAVRSDLEGIRTKHPAAQTLMASTRELIERNEARLATNVGEGSGQGYLDHPDYAELGRIQSNLQLLRSIDDVERAVPASAAPAPVAAPAPGSAEEILSW
jgi:hypothetical protein